jgi:hypothetical protein
MDEEEIKNLLRKNLETSEKSLAILKRLHRAQKTSRFFKILKWLIILALTFGLYYYLEPYLRGLINTYQNLLDTASSLQKNSRSINLENIQPDMLKRIKELGF